MIPLKNYPLSTINNFEKAYAPLLNFIRATWKCEVSPLDVEGAEFKGADTTMKTHPIHERLTASYVEHGKDQGRDALEILISSCMAYGMILERERFDRVKEFNLNRAMKSFETSTKCVAAEFRVSDENGFLEEITKTLRSAFDIWEFDGHTLTLERYDSRTVAQWEDDPEGMKVKEEKDHAEISAIVDKILADKLKG